MEIKYLTILKDNPSRFSDGTLPNESMGMREIIELERLYNNSEPFPVVIQELLWIGGEYNWAMGATNGFEWLQTFVREYLTGGNLPVITRPFFVLETLGLHYFNFIYLDEDVEDPIIYWTQYSGASDSKSNKAESTGKTVSELILHKAICHLNFRDKSYGQPSKYLNKSESIVDIVYRTRLDDIITLRQALALGKYHKQYIHSDGIKKEELFYEGKLRILVYYKSKHETHEEILAVGLIDGRITIREIEYFGDYRLERDFIYDKKSVLCLYCNELYDPNNYMVAHEFRNLDGAVDYSETEKYYYPINHKPDLVYDGYLFRCEYGHDGSLLEVYFEYPNSHPQDAMYFYDEPSSISKLMAHAGISQTLMDYYISPDVIPKGELK